MNPSHGSEDIDWVWEEKAILCDLIDWGFTPVVRNCISISGSDDFPFPSHHGEDCTCVIQNGIFRHSNDTVIHVSRRTLWTCWTHHQGYRGLYHDNDYN
jgi:hypothetical protein